MSAGREAGDQKVAFGQLGDAPGHGLGDRIVRVGIAGALITDELQRRLSVGGQVGEAEVFGPVQVDDPALASELP